jgi:hypothetical protein
MYWRYLYILVAAIGLMLFATRFGQRALFFPDPTAERVIQREGFKINFFKEIGNPAPSLVHPAASVQMPSLNYRCPDTQYTGWYVVSGGSLATLPCAHVSARFAQVVAGLSGGAKIFFARSPYSIAIVKTGGARVWVFDALGPHPYPQILTALSQDEEPQGSDVAIAPYDKGQGVYVLPEHFYLRLATVDESRIVTFLEHYEIFRLPGGRLARLKCSVGNGLAPAKFAFMLD